MFGRISEAVTNGINWLTRKKEIGGKRQGKLVAENTEIENLTNLQVTRSKHSIIITASEKKFALVPKLTEKEWEQFLKENPAYKYAAKSVDKNGNIKVVIGKGAFGKVRLAREIDADGNMIGPLKAVKKTFFDPNDKKKSLEVAEKEFFFHKNYLTGLPVAYIDDAAKTIDSKNRTAIYQVMDLAGFGDGKKFIKLTSQNNSSEVNITRLHIAKSFLSAMESLHENKIIHRDMKPGNILLDMNGNVKISDFGAAIKKSLLNLNNDEVSNQTKNTNDTVSEFIDRSGYTPELLFDNEVYSYEAIDCWQSGLTLLQLYGADISRYKKNMQSGNYLDISKESQNPKPGFTQRRDLFKEVHEWEINNLIFKTKIPAEIKDIIKELLNSNPDKRMSLKDATSKLKEYEKNVTKRQELVTDVLTHLAQSKPLTSTNTAEFKIDTQEEEIPEIASERFYQTPEEFVLIDDYNYDSEDAKINKKKWEIGLTLLQFYNRNIDEYFHEMAKTDLPDQTIFLDLLENEIFEGNEYDVAEKKLAKNIKNSAILLNKLISEIPKDIQPVVSGLLKTIPDERLDIDSAYEKMKEYYSNNDNQEIPKQIEAIFHPVIETNIDMENLEKNSLSETNEKEYDDNEDEVRSEYLESENEENQEDKNDNSLQPTTKKESHETIELHRTHDINKQIGVNSSTLKIEDINNTNDEKIKEALDKIKSCTARLNLLNQRMDRTKLAIQNYKSGLDRQIEEVKTVLNHH